MTTFNSLFAQLAAETVKKEQKVCIVEAVRTPLCKAKKGAFKDTTADVLLAHVLRDVVKRTNGKVNVGDVDDIIVGNVLQPGGGAAMARMSMLAGGFPDTTTVSTTNRQCSSGLQALASVAGSLLLGATKLSIAAGVESMSNDNI